MALVLNEEQHMLKEAAKGFLQEHAPVEALRKLRDEGDPLGYSTGLWQQMAEMGWAGILIDEAHGGLDFGHVGMGQVMEEIGRTLTASPLFSSAVLGASAIGLGGSAEQKSQWLPAIAEGRLLCTLAIDTNSHHNPALTGVSASSDGSAYTLNGEKQFVTDGHVAEQIIVSARTGGNEGDESEVSLFVVNAKAPGVEIERVIMADHNNAAHLRLSNVQLDQSHLLGKAGEATSLLREVIAIGNVHLAAQLLGCSLEVLERTVEYMKERKQYGVLIGSYQGLQHRAAHLFSEIELTKSVVLKALQAFDQQAADRELLASVAKAKASEVATLATNEGVQMHGGIGMTDELDIGLFMKRARVAEHLLGDQGYHMGRFAELKGY